MNNKLATFVLVAVTGFVAPVTFVGCASHDPDSHKRTAGQYIDDKVLAQKVRSALGDNDVYKLPHVKVNTYKGTVQLSGFVESPDQQRKAEDIVRNVNGVSNVQNNIVLKGETERVRGSADYQNTTPNSTTPNTTYPNRTTIP